MQWCARVEVTNAWSTAVSTRQTSLTGCDFVCRHVQWNAFLARVVMPSIVRVKWSARPVRIAPKVWSTCVRPARGPRRSQHNAHYVRRDIMALVARPVNSVLGRVRLVTGLYHVVCVLVWHADA
jgi:hypothetical protein